MATQRAKITPENISGNLYTPTDHSGAEEGAPSALLDSLIMVDRGGGGVNLEHHHVGKRILIGARQQGDQNILDLPSI